MYSEFLAKTGCEVSPEMFDKINQLYTEGPWLNNSAFCKTFLKHYEERKNQPDRLINTLRFIDCAYLPLNTPFIF